jgi:hypothetical protein
MVSSSPPVTSSGHTDQDVYLKALAGSEQPGSHCLWQLRGACEVRAVVRVQCDERSEAADRSRSTPGQTCCSAEAVIAGRVRRQGLEPEPAD